MQVSHVEKNMMEQKGGSPKQKIIESSLCFGILSRLRTHNMGKSKLSLHALHSKRQVGFCLEGGKTRQHILNMKQFVLRP